MERFIRIGVVTAWPDDDWHSRRLLAAFRARTEAEPLDPAALSGVTGPGGAEVTLSGRSADAYGAFVLARGLGRGGDADVQFELYRALEARAVVVNRIDPLLAAQDKFRTSWLLRRAGVPTPDAAVAQTPLDAVRALARLREAVVKPLAGSLGEDVERVRDAAPGRRRVAERVEAEGAVYLQAFVPHPGLDARVFVVGGRARAAIARRAPPGDWRTNVAGGGEVEPLTPSGRLAAAAEAAAAALGLDYAGVDVVQGAGGPEVIEVNGNPSWQGILEATGEDMADAIAEHVLGRAVRRRRTRDHIVRERTGATHG
jgi:ribosomal protein S6--L-glutamate ligase